MHLKKRHAGKGSGFIVKDAWFPSDEHGKKLGPI
jgi:hypothetical protein